MCIVLYDWDEAKQKSVLIKKESHCEDCSIRLNNRGCNGTQEYQNNNTKQMTIFDFLKG